MKQTVSLGMCNKGLIGVIVIGVCLGCSRINETALFDFPVESITDINYTDTLSPIPLHVDAELVEFAIIDDRVFSYSTSGHDFLSVTSLDGNTSPIYLCHEGRGPGEFLAMAPSFDYFDGCLGVMDSFLGKYSYLNLKESLDSTRTIIDREFDLPWDINSSHQIRSAYSFGNDSLLVYLITMASDPQSRKSLDVPEFLLFNLSTNEIVKTYKSYNPAPSRIREKPTMDLQLLYYSWQCMDSSRDRLCFAMLRMPQINILDIHSGSIRGFRFDDRPQFSCEKMYLYFMSVCSHGDMIYALYSGDEGMEASSLPTSPGTLYVFDWDGNIHEKYLLNAPYQRCVVTSDGIYLSKYEEDTSMGLYFVPLKETVL